MQNGEDAVTRDDLCRFCGLEIDFESIGLMEPGVDQPPYFCTPMGAEYVVRLGADGIHFVLLPGDERVFCVDPAMGEPGTYVLPVAEDMRQFLSFLLYCRDANPISQIWWLEEERFRQLLEEDAQARWPGCEPFLAKKEEALSAVREAFGLTPADPYAKVKELQAVFNPEELSFSDEYYEVLGIERP